MEVTRRIGSASIVVDTAEPCGIYLLEKAGDGADTVSVTRKDFLRSLAGPGVFTPLTCQWEILDRCNLACPFCYIVGHSNRKVVRYHEVAGHLDDLIGAGLLFCTITGGDPLIHPDFEKIYRHLKESGVVTTVFTNGIAITKGTIALLVSLPPKEVEVSIYTLSDDVFRNTFRARRGDAARVLDNILMLKAAGINVTCKTFINKITAPGMDDIVAWCDKFGLDHYASSDLNQAYDGASLEEFRVEPLYSLGRRAAAVRPRLGMPCDTRQYGGAIDAGFRFSACPAIRHEEAFTDLRESGVAMALEKTLGFVQAVQDLDIAPGSGATCVAKASLCRSAAGQLSLS